VQDGQQEEEERRLLAYSLGMLGQRTCQFVSATLLKMGSDRGALPLTARQLGTLSSFLSGLLQLQILQWHPDGQDDGMGAAVATTLQTVGELVRDHGARLLAAAAGDDPHHAEGSDKSSAVASQQEAPPLVFLALRLAAPPSTTLRGGRGGEGAAWSSLAAVYEVQHAAVDVLAAAVAHKVRTCMHQGLRPDWTEPPISLSTPLLRTSHRRSPPSVLMTAASSRRS
jgi:hypothetical protein